MDSIVSKSLKSGAPPAMGKYLPFARLGNGGMADVFLALARGPAGFNKLTVIKRLRNHGDDSLVGMFLDEARLSARLSHPNIVNTYEVGEADGRFFIAMEYLEGQPLQALLSLLAGRPSGLSDTMVAFVAMQALKGLHYAHELTDYDGTQLGVVHRDVSPHNIFVTYGGEVKLLDFGIAKATVNSTHTATGVLKGKVRYMAPEAVEERSVDRRADVYAMGIVLWEMLARRQLHTGDSLSILTRIASEDPPLVGTIRPDVSPELEEIAGKALRRDVNQRYASAGAMRVDLEQFLRGRAESALDSELGRIMDTTFADTREAVRARIKSHLAMLPEAPPESSAAVSRLVQSTASIPPLFGEGSGPSASRRRTSAPPAPSEPSIAPRSRRSLVIAALAVVLIGALALGIGLITIARAKGTPVPAAEASVAAAAQPFLLPPHLRLETTPPLALVEWNGKPIDRTPAEIDLRPGRQTLTVSLEGYDPQQIAVDAEAGKRITRAVVLRAKAPPAAAPSSPPTPPAAAAPGRPIFRKRPFRPAAAPPATASAAPRTKVRVIDDGDSP